MPVKATTKCEPIPKEDLGVVIMYIFALIIGKARIVHSRQLKGNASQVQAAFYKAHLQFPGIFDNLLFIDKTTVPPYSSVLRNHIIRMKTSRVLSTETTGSQDNLYMSDSNVLRCLLQFRGSSLYVSEDLIDFLIEELEI